MIKTFFTALLLSIGQAVELNHNTQEPADFTLAQTTADSEAEVINETYAAILNKGGAATIDEIELIVDALARKKDGLTDGD